MIPASNGGDCTGAKSVITNHVGESYAHIKFYDELEMIEQIQKYMDAIGIHRKLTTLAQVPSLKSDIEDFISTQSGVSGKNNLILSTFVSMWISTMNTKDMLGQHWLKRSQSS